MSRRYDQIAVQDKFKVILTWRGRGSCSPKRVINKARRLIEYTALHAAVCGRLWLQLRLYVRRRIFARVGLCACRRSRTHIKKKGERNSSAWRVLDLPQCALLQVVLVIKRFGYSKSYLLGLLAKIKCSICSYQLNLWYGGHWPPSRLNLFLYRVGDHTIYRAPAQVTSVLHTFPECCW